MNKKCSTCNVVKSLCDFNKNKSHKDGYHNQCRNCNKKYYRNNKTDRLVLRRTWNGINARCYNPKCKGYHRYGKRGIIVCDEWHDFNIFYEWAMSNGYKQGLEIDRIDNNDIYNPTNCHFVECVDNIRNSSSTKLNVSKVKEIRTLYKHGKVTHEKLALQYGVKRRTITDIINMKTWNNI